MSLAVELCRALRSGQYKQIRGRWRDLGNGRCVLGVAEDLGMYRIPDAGIIITLNDCVGLSFHEIADLIEAGEIVVEPGRSRSGGGKRVREHLERRRVRRHASWWIDALAWFVREPGLDVIGDEGGHDDEPPPGVLVVSIRRRRPLAPSTGVAKQFPRPRRTLAPAWEPDAYPVRRKAAAG